MSTNTNEAATELPLPLMMRAFCVSTSEGEGRYSLQFKFNSMGDMHRASDEWYKFCTAALASQVPGGAVKLQREFENLAAQQKPLDRDMAKIIFDNLWELYSTDDDTPTPPVLAAEAASVGSASYVQSVPDKCDRIIWRGAYYHLPLAAPKFRKLTNELTLMEIAAEFNASAELGCDCTISPGVCGKLFAAMTTPAAAPATPSVPGYEQAFQERTVELVMSHIDRMNDTCPKVDPAERIIESFVSKFNPILEAYWAEKFPGRAAPQATQPEAAPSDDSDRCTNCGLFCLEGACVYGAPDAPVVAEGDALTDEQIADIYEKSKPAFESDSAYPGAVAFARAILKTAQAKQPDMEALREKILALKPPSPNPMWRSGFFECRKLAANLVAASRKEPT